jgi:hypothetical protein
MTIQLSEKMSRLGTESAFDVLAKAEALAATGRSVINLGIGQPDFKTPPNVVEAAVKALRDGHHGYTQGVEDDGHWQPLVLGIPNASSFPMMPSLRRASLGRRRARQVQVR